MVCLHPAFKAWYSKLSGQVIGFLSSIFIVAVKLIATAICRVINACANDVVIHRVCLRVVRVASPCEAWHLLTNGVEPVVGPPKVGSAEKVGKSAPLGAQEALSLLRLLSLIQLVDLDGVGFCHQP